LRAFIVVDLGFGDSGKGLLTDFLVRRTSAGLVVRFNGGAQAGHRVIAPDGRSHTFAQFGAGTLAGGRTFLSRHVLVHPTALLREGAALEQSGVREVFSRIAISENARLITPFHQAANRLREMIRGESRHGSCGIGVGETVQDSRDYPNDAIVAGDLRDQARLRRKVQRLHERKRIEMRKLCSSAAGAELDLELGIFERTDLVDLWIEEASRLGALGVVAPDSRLGEWMGNCGAVVFEGAQGVLLDAWRGFHPYTTWSCCTFDNALELLSEFPVQLQAFRIGVLRTHAVRHGAGPLPSEAGAMPPPRCEHNRENRWQGRVRYGWFDAVLARYALDAVGGVDALALTHVDGLKRLPRWTVCTGYLGAGMPQNAEPIAYLGGDGLVTRLVVPVEESIDRQVRLTQLLSRVAPRLEEFESKETSVFEQVQRLLARTVDIVSRGPCATDVFFRKECLAVSAAVQQMRE